MELKTVSFGSDTLAVKPLCSALVARNAASFAVSVIPLLRPGLQLEIDFSDLVHIDGAGLGALISCRHATKRMGCDVVLTQVPMHLAEELEACGLRALLAPLTDDSAPTRPVP